MKTFVQCFAVLLVVQSGFAFECPSCADSSCGTSDEEIQMCTVRPPTTNFVALDNVKLEEAVFGCLDLEYKEGIQLRKLKQCVHVKAGTEACEELEQEVEVVKCNVKRKVPINYVNLPAISAEDVPLDTTTKGETELTTSSNLSSVKTDPPTTPTIPPTDSTTAPPTTLAVTTPAVTTPAVTTPAATTPPVLTTAPPEVTTDAPTTIVTDAPTTPGEGDTTTPGVETTTPDGGSLVHAFSIFSLLVLVLTTYCVS